LVGKKLIRILRYLVQAVSLLFFVFLVANLIYPLEQGDALQWVTRTDPWEMFNFLRWNDLFLPDWFWLPAVTIIVTLVFGRVFCGWLCPFGALQMLADKAGRFIFKNGRHKKVVALRAKTARALSIARWFWLFFLIVFFILGSNFLMSLTPFSLLSGETVNILRGVVPWALIAIMIANVLFSRVWCNSVCPTGILLSLISKLRIFRYSISEDCTKCGRCVDACSVGTAPGKPGAMEEGCIACGDCVSACPEKAVGFFGPGKKRKKESKEDAPVKEKAGHTRREFLKISVAAVAAASIFTLGKTVKTTNKILRPPGALDEEIFTSVCSRCGRCIKVCPNEALIPMPVTEGIECYGTPYIIPRQGSCVLCMACQEVCPTGAIERVPPDKVKMGSSSIDEKRCLAWSFDKLCFVCGEQCPMLAIEPDDLIRPVVDPNICVGCGTCEKACPVEGEAAIRVDPNNSSRKID
jgi:MauM/NapG family ferredoxin protein